MGYREPRSSTWSLFATCYLQMIQLSGWRSGTFRLLIGSDWLRRSFIEACEHKPRSETLRHISGERSSLSLKCCWSSEWKQSARPAVVKSQHQSLDLTPSLAWRQINPATLWPQLINLQLRLIDRSISKWWAIINSVPNNFSISSCTVQLVDSVGQRIII